jgi:phospholipid-binding lipoprotein MlaA
MVHRTCEKRLGVMLLAVLAIALAGCGALAEKLGAPMNTSLLERTDGSPLDPSSTLSDTAVPPTAPPAEVRGEVRLAAASRPDDVLTDAPSTEFIPVAFEPMPSGYACHLMVSPDRAEGLPPVMVAQTGGASETKPADTKAAESKTDKSEFEEVEEYDPWEKFNEKMFTFNYNLDKYILKPVAKGYNFIVPDLFQRMISNGFDNIQVVPRLVNNILQWQWKGFFTELGRFLINSTLGIGGLFDIAKQEFGLFKTKVDFGQTLGKWGFPPGPFLVLPLMPPLTVRDGIGTGVDGAMDPFSYILPISFFPDRLVMRIGNMVNERSLNLELFQGFEETTVDMYSAVRNGYLQRRYNLIHNTP